jgi:alpha-beta hydrolase superfamily lysophospholipase
VKSILINILTILIPLYVVICLVIYFFQERLIFFPEKLKQDFVFGFPQPFEELTVRSADDKSLHGILFKAKNPKGLVFYLHGNAGSLNSWGDVAETYTSLDYDVFLPDYRGYGKSEGKITSESQFISDLQLMYDQVKSRYDEKKIVVLGYSIGSGPAAAIAAANNPRLLILQAPYYNMTDMLKHTYPFLPPFLLKYKFDTNKYLDACKMPVVLFHGEHDEVIYYGSSVKLKAHLKHSDTLITLYSQTHNGITENLQYQQALAGILQ